MATELTLVLYLDGYVPTRDEVEECFDCTIIEYNQEEV